ncbi:hypothetical protein HZB69_03640 [Candidatus Amesbacteria bacterium]|nr:hypothetical protein [Candidatus Amesbacteria bacterium]
MKSLTVHDIPDELYLRLREVAADQNLSLGATFKVAAGNYVGLTKKKKDFSMLKKMWTKEEGEAFDKYVEEAFEQIDEEDWK